MHAAYKINKCSYEVFRSCTFISDVKSFRAMNDGKLEYFFLSLNIWQLSGLIIWQLFFLYSRWEIKIKSIESTARERLDKYVESCKIFSEENTIGKYFSHTCSAIFAKMPCKCAKNDTPVRDKKVVENVGNLAYFFVTL